MGQSIAKKMLGIKVVRTDGSPVSLGRLIWLRNVVNGLHQHHPALRPRRRALHLRGIAAVSARQDCGHHRRQSLRVLLSARGTYWTRWSPPRRPRDSARAASGRSERSFLRVRLDWVIRLAILYAAAITVAAMGGIGIAFWLILFFALEWFYPVAFELTPSGATPGKRVFGSRS